MTRWRQRALNVRSWGSFPACDAKSVAVVGNAGYLGELAQGPRIDSYELVIRMNNFQISGFEAQVGTRVDVFFTNFFTDIRYERPELDQAKYIVASVPNNFQKLHRHHIHHRHAEHIVAGLEALRRTDVFVPEWDTFHEQVRRCSSFPSTGMMAMLFALNVLRCDTLLITGFSFFQDRPHYFQDQPASAKDHDFAQERTYLRTLLVPHVASSRVLIDPLMAERLQLPSESR